MFGFLGVGMQCLIAVCPCVLCIILNIHARSYLQTHSCKRGEMRIPHDISFVCSIDGEHMLDPAPFQ